MRSDTSYFLKPSFLLAWLLVCTANKTATTAPAARMYDADLIDKVIEKAYSYYESKTPYKWGGEAYSGIDCSGLTYLSFRAAGIQIPRNSAMQAAYRDGKYIPKDKLRRGDLLFFDSNSDGRVDHVGLAISGSGSNVRFIHSSSTNRGVAINRLSESYWRNRYKSDVGKRLFNHADGSEENEELLPILSYNADNVPGKYPQTALKKLRAEDLQNLSNRELKIMKNEVYARYGYEFHVNPAMVSHFQKQAWYQQVPKTTQDAGYLYVHALNRNEQYNVTLLQKWLERKQRTRESL